MFEFEKLMDRTEEDIPVFKIIKKDKVIVIKKKKDSPPPEQKQSEEEEEDMKDDKEEEEELFELKKPRFDQHSPAFFICAQEQENLPDISSIFKGKIWLAQTEQGVKTLIRKMLKGNKISDLDPQNPFYISIDTEWHPFSNEKTIDVIQLKWRRCICISTKFERSKEISTEFSSKKFS